MSYVILGFLWVALLIYILTGGADYGAGILECFSSEQKKEQIRINAYKAIGPVWEANHMWLIIAVVIMFVGFPQIFYTVAIYLHIPLVCMLLGIIARGTAFTFRNYDAVKDNTQSLYNRIYIYSSFITPFFLGTIAGSAVSGLINPRAKTFMEAYVYDWLNIFSLSIGLFTVFLCGFIAAVYLSGVVSDTKKNIYIEKTRLMTILGTGTLGCIFWSSSNQHIPLSTWLFGNVPSVLTSCLTLVFFILTWAAIKTKGLTTVRVLVGSTVTSLWIAITYGHFPDIVIMKNGATLSLLDPSVPRETINVLGLALLGGSVLILPSLFYLLYSFNKKIPDDYFSDPTNN